MFVTAPGRFLLVLRDIGETPVDWIEKNLPKNRQRREEKKEAINILVRWLANGKLQQKGKRYSSAETGSSSSNVENVIKT